MGLLVGQNFWNILCEMDVLYLVAHLKSQEGIICWDISYQLLILI